MGNKKKYVEKPIQFFSLAFVHISAKKIKKKRNKCHSSVCARRQMSLKPLKFSPYDICAKETNTNTQLNKMFVWPIVYSTMYCHSYDYYSFICSNIGPIQTTQMYFPLSPFISIGMYHFVLCLNYSYLFMF